MTATRRADGATVRVLSVHLDSDSAGTRRREFRAALRILPGAPDTIDVIAGDFNSDTDTGNLHVDLAKAGFVDVLATLGAATYTSPWSETYYGHGPWGIIDHIAARGARPTAGRVYDFGQFDLFPNDQDARIEQNLLDCGSDHYPISGAVTR